MEIFFLAHPFVFFLMILVGVLYFILREMTHDETATEAQYQNDDGEHHGCSIRPVLYILLRRAQLEEYAQGQGGCLR